MSKSIAHSLILLQHAGCELKRNISFIQYNSDSRHMGESWVSPDHKQYQVM